MKLLHRLFGALVVASSFISGSAFAQADSQTNTAPTENVQTLSDKLNINTATAAEIQQAMVGIGAKKAEAIVQYREKHGSFTALEQLLEVKGIGKATLEKNLERISL